MPQLFRMIEKLKNMFNEFRVGSQPTRWGTMSECEMASHGKLHMRGPLSQL